MTVAGKKQTSKMRDFAGKAGPDAAPYEEAVKLIHTRDLEGLPRIPRYQDHDGITLADYRAQRKHLQSLRSKCKDLLDTRRWLREHDHDDLVHCDSVEANVPRSLFRKEVWVEIPRSRYEKAVPQSESGPVTNGRVLVRSGWRKRVIEVRYRCPSDVFHQDAIAERKQRMASSSPEEIDALQQIDRSPFSAPLLFISHRWQGRHHPDPDGEVLARLQELGDAFLIFDYSSFPQEPLDSELAAKLSLILEHMDKLMYNLVVLDHPEYLQRGWCIYEYLGACLSGRLVCDEVGDKRFKELLRWVRTKPSPSRNPFRDGAEALQANCIQESILRAVNELLPVIGPAEYTIPTDRSIVRTLLREMLKERLPNKREYDPYLGESQAVGWADEELENAFEGSLKWQSMQTMPTRAFEVNVPSSLQAADEQGFRVPVDPSPDYQLATMIQSPFAELAQFISGAFASDDFSRLSD